VLNFAGWQRAIASNPETNVDITGS
jgi:hypothetical protein